MPARDGGTVAAHLTGSGRIDSAALSLDQQITRLLDVEGKLTPLDARVTGTSGLTGLRASTLSRFLPERAAAIESLFDKPIDCSLAFGVRNERQTVEAVVTKSGRPAPMLQVAAVEMPDFLHVETATFQNDMNPALFEALQSEKEKTERIVLDRPAELRLVLQPFDLPGNRSSGFEMPTSPLAARVEADEIVLSQVPALAQSIGARQFAATVSITLPKDADPAYTVTGSTASSRSRPPRSAP